MQDEIIDTKNPHSSSSIVRKKCYMSQTAYEMILLIDRHTNRRTTGIYSAPGAWKQNA